MQTVDERPTEFEVVKPVIQTQTPGIDPISVQYIPFEESFWSRHRAFIWTLVILFFVGIGAVALILPGFAVAC